MLFRTCVLQQFIVGKLRTLACSKQARNITLINLLWLTHKIFVSPRSTASSSPARYSGITPQLLEKVETRLHQVQATLLRIVGARDILVGHSLENDLKALKMVHLRCLDTSLLYPHPKKGRRSSLRYLVSM